MILFRYVYIEGTIGKPMPPSQQKETLNTNTLGQCFHDATGHPLSLPETDSHRPGAPRVMLGSDPH